MELPSPKMTHDCQQCGRPVRGRSDKRFCSSLCKNQTYYAQHLKDQQPILRALQHNRNILRSLCEGDCEMTIMSRANMERLGFYWDTLTHFTYHPLTGHLYFGIYEFNWRFISMNTVQIVVQNGSQNMVKNPLHSRQIHQSNLWTWWSQQPFYLQQQVPRIK